MLRALLVDDDRAAADTLAAGLRRHGWRVRVCGNGMAALRHARRWRPDVVIAEVVLPDLDGIRLARQLRRQPELAGTALVALTGLDGLVARRVATAAGFDQFLVKPIQAADLRGLHTERLAFV